MSTGQIRLTDSVVSIGEEAGSVTVQVERIGKRSGSASVQFSTLDASAQAGNDYVATN